MADINGNGADNDLLGTPAGDTLRGRGGDDSLEGRGGNDTLVGGSGADAFLFRGDAFGVDRVNDFSRAAGDVIHLVDVERGRNDIERFAELDTNRDGRLDAADDFVSLTRNGNLKIVLNRRDGDDPAAILIVKGIDSLVASDFDIDHFGGGIA